MGGAVDNVGRPSVLSVPSLSRLATFPPGTDSLRQEGTALTCADRGQGPGAPSPSRPKSRQE